MITVFLVILTLIGLRERTSGTVPLGLLEPAPTALECRQVVRLGEWGWEHHGGPNRAALDAPEFFETMAEEIADRLDPLKIWILDSEINDFASGNFPAWQSALAGDCDPLERALVNWYAEGKTRLAAHFTGLQAEFQPHRKLPNPTEPDGYPTSRSQAYARMTELARYHLTVASPALRDAFRQDAGRFLEDTFYQLALPSQMAPRQWLAKAVLGGLDAYSTYFPPEEWKDFENELRGEVSGIGVRVRQVPAGYLVEGVLNGTPAQEMGIKEGETVLSIDGMGLAGMSPKQAGALFSGPAGSEINLKLTALDGALRTLVLVRRPFDLEGAKIEGRIEKGSRGSDVGIIKVPSFYGGVANRSSADDLKTVLEDMLHKQVDSLVLDLRGNPGGYLDEAVTMASYFIGDEPVVAVVSRDNERVMTNPEQALYEGPLVVLLDEESASAAEVLAGALKDHQRALLVGSDRTFGKGSVQKLFHLDDELLSHAVDGLPGDGVVKLTTSLFYSPLGHSPANGGVETHLKLSQSRSTKAKARKAWDTRPFLDKSAMNRLKEIRPNWDHLASRLGEVRVTSEQIKSVWTPFWRPDALADVANVEQNGVKQAVSIASEIPVAREWKEVRQKAPWGEDKP